MLLLLAVMVMQVLHRLAAERAACVAAAAAGQAAK